MFVPSFTVTRFVHLLFSRESVWLYHILGAPGNMSFSDRVLAGAMVVEFVVLVITMVICNATVAA